MSMSKDMIYFSAIRGSRGNALAELRGRAFHERTFDERKRTSEAEFFFASSNGSELPLDVVDE